MVISSQQGQWASFWHQPVRAERLALMRILLGLALLTNQLFLYLPHLEDFFGPTGMAPQGLHDWSQARHWRLSILLFNQDAPRVVYPLFAAWVAVTGCWLIGWRARLMNVLVWFLTMAFLCRNSVILNGGDDALQVGIFLLILSPTGRALSVDAWLRRRRQGRTGPEYTPAWPLRLIQIELCLIYLTTGICKLEGSALFRGTWWDGTSIHYVLNDMTIVRWPYTQVPLPFWVTAAMTYISVWWEVLFPLLVLYRRTRYPALVFGLLFHLGIWLTIEIAWFSFFTLCFYAVWVPDSFWERRFPARAPESQLPRQVAAPKSVAVPAGDGMSSPLAETSAPR